MFREGLIAAATLSGALTACTETDQPLPEHIQAAKTEYVDTVGCPIDPEINLEDIDSPVAQPDGTEGRTIGYAIRDRDLIVLDSKVVESEPAKLTRDTLFHEMGHICVEESFNYFERRYELSDGRVATGASGFNLHFDNADLGNDNSLPYPEEGFAEWIANEEFDDYEPSTIASYAVVRYLTGTLISRANLSVEDVVTMHEQSDLVGFVSALLGKDVDELNSRDLENFITLYEEAGRDLIIPHDYALDEMGF